MYEVHPGNQQRLFIPIFTAYLQLKIRLFELPLKEDSSEAKYLPGQRHIKLTET